MQFSSHYILDRAGPLKNPSLLEKPHHMIDLSEPCQQQNRKLHDRPPHTRRMHAHGLLVERHFAIFAKIRFRQNVLHAHNEVSHFHFHVRQVMISVGQIHGLAQVFVSMHLVFLFDSDAKAHRILGTRSRGSNADLHVSARLGRVHNGSLLLGQLHRCGLAVTDFSSFEVFLPVVRVEIVIFRGLLWRSGGDGDPSCCIRWVFLVHNNI